MSITSWSRYSQHVEFEDINHKEMDILTYHQMSMSRHVIIHTSTKLNQQDKVLNSTGTANQICPCFNTKNN